MKHRFNVKVLRRVGVAVLFIIIFFILFFLFQRLLTAKILTTFDEDVNLASQWDEFESLNSGDLDVLFVGTSHVYCGIDPMYIYENSGITSFDLCFSSSHFETDYLLAYEGLREQSPKVLFLDMSSIHYSEPLSAEKTRILLDQIPFSFEKIRFAEDREDINLLNVIFPLLYYHSRWDELSMIDFKHMIGRQDETYTRGHYITYEIKSTKFKFFKEGGKIGISEEYGWPDLEKIRDLCAEKNVELILFKVPTPRWKQSQSEAAQQIADALGLPFWDLTYEIEDIGLDPSTDFRDKRNHMNQYGAEKLSAYMMNYLEESYHFEDKRGNDSKWDNALIEYNELLNSKKAEEEK